MRRLFVICAFALAAGSASASSIEPVVSGKAVNHSITRIDCNSCPPLVDRKKKPTYSVSDIKPGQQQIELKTIGGELKVIRTEAWNGGSPVVFVSKAPEDVARAYLEAERGPPAISQETVSSTTKEVPVIGSDSAVKSASIAGSKRAVAPQSQQFDPSKFEMRLD